MVQDAGSEGVTLRNETSSLNSYFYQDTIDFDNASWYTDAGINYVSLDTSNAVLLNQLSDADSASQNSLVISDLTNSFTLTGIGNINGNGTTVTLTVTENPILDLSAIIQIELVLVEVIESTLTLTNNDLRVDVADDIRMFATDVFRLYNRSTTEPIELITNVGGTANRWEFGADGALNLPGVNESGPAIQSPTIQSLNTYPTLLAYGDSEHGGPELDWTNSVNRAGIFDNTVLRNTAYLNAQGFYIGINENNVDGSPSPSWQFGAAGTLTFPNGGSLRVGPAPSSSAGAVGDTAGTVAYDSNYIYYCVQDHGGGQNTFVTTVADGGAGVGTIPVVKGSYGTPTTAWTVTFLAVDYAITNVTDGGASWVLTTPGQLASGGDGISVGLFNGVTGNDIWVKQAWGTTGTW
jgi:hypothetical protein